MKHISDLDEIGDSCGLAPSNHDYTVESYLRVRLSVGFS